MNGSALPIRRAADIAGLPIRAIIEEIEAGRVFGRRVAAGWYISSAALPRLRELAEARRAERGIITLQIKRSLTASQSLSFHGGDIMPASSPQIEPQARGAPPRAAPPSGPSVAQQIYENAPAALREVLDKTDRRAWRAAEEGYYTTVALSRLDLAELREAAQNGNATALKIVRIRERAMAAADFKELWTPDLLAWAARFGFTEADLQKQFDKERAADAAGRTT